MLPILTDINYYVHLIQNRLVASARHFSFPVITRVLSQHVTSQDLIKMEWPGMRPDAFHDIHGCDNNYWFRREFNLPKLSILSFWDHAILPSGIRPRIRLKVIFCSINIFKDEVSELTAARDPDKWRKFSVYIHSN
jgi:hypothetical protein